MLAARAALAVAKQGRYLDFHARLMETRFMPTLAYVEALAEDIGLDQSQLVADMDAPDIAAHLQRSAMLASRFGFVGTPGMVVGRTIVQGAITRAALEDLIAEEAAAGAAGVC